MEVAGSCMLPLVFAPVDQIFRVKFRVVGGLPYAMVLGVACIIEHQVIISFDGDGGFRTAPSSSWVPFTPKEVNEAAAGEMDTVWDHFYAVRPLMQG